MASGINNWVHEKGNVTDKDIVALEKARRQEKQYKKKGYRWIRINQRLQIFVPCDTKGNPTKVGEEKIRALKASQGIK